MTVLLGSLGSFWTDLRDSTARLSTETAFSPIQVAWEQWLDQHWLIHFFLYHPLSLLGLILIIVFLVSGILRAVSRTSENFWILLLKLPLRGLGWLGAQGLTWFRQGQQAKTSGDRLKELLTRLDSLRAEQDSILDEVKTLLPQTATQTISKTPSQTASKTPLKPPSKANDKAASRSKS